MGVGEGHGAVRIVDTSGNTAQFDTSGRITIAGGSITASVSGDTVIAKISGETISSSISGQVISVRTSGGSQVIPILLQSSGGVFAVLSSTTSENIATGTTVGLQTPSFPFVFLEQSGWVRARGTQSGVPMSGVGYALAVNFSGAVCTASGDIYQIRSSGGNSSTMWLTNQAGTSGIDILSYNTDNNTQNPPRLQVWANLSAFNEASGTVSRLRVTQSGVAISGIGNKLLVGFSGDAVSISGNNIKEFGSTVKTGEWIQIHGASGGQQLSGATCFTATIRSHSGNALMLVGGTGTQAPVSGTKGLHLFGGESYEARVSNLNQISIVAHTSGQYISYALVE